MSSNLPSLNDDILLHIFDLNADMFNDDDTMSTACITSQVCQHWRSLMLGTPFLWAKLIDMDELSLKNDGKWRNELIHRSGDAPLWIRAENARSIKVYHEERSPYEIDMHAFFEEFITNNWHRIEKLVLSHNSAFELTRSMMCLPAPLLKHIEAAAPPLPGCSEPLFANQAPMLRNIYLGNNSVDQRAPWLCHLHSLTLNGSYSLSNVLAILSATRDLQELKLANITSGRIDTSLPVIYLSSLHSLTYWVNSLNAGVELLDHIEIPVSCRLNIDLENYPNNRIYAYQRPFILSTIDIFMRHAERFLKSHTLTGVYLDYVQKNYISWGFQANSPIKPSLGISIPLNRDFDISILDLFSMKLLSMYFKSSIYLIITAHGESISHFGSFFSHLPSVDTISADLVTFLHLAQFQHSVNSNATGAPSIIFPMLKVIRLFNHRKVPQGNSDVIDAIVGQFLDLRAQAGLPLTTLDLSLIQPLDTPLHFPALEETMRLTVLYRLKGNESVIRYTRGVST